MGEINIPMKTNVKVAVRKFSPDPAGKDIARDGTRGTYGEWEVQDISNLLTDAGRDWLHTQGYATTGIGTNGGNYIALSTSTASASDSDTSVTGEITGGGLARAQGTVSHTAGNSTTTIKRVFTASTTHTDVQLCGLLTAASSGTLIHEATFSAVTLAANDQLQILWTVTLDD